MTEVTLLGPGGATAAKQDVALAQLVANGATLGEIKAYLATIDSDALQTVINTAAVVSSLGSDGGVGPANGTGLRGWLRGIYERLTGTVTVAGTVATDDSSEREYGPGLKGQVVTAAGDTPVFIPTSGKAWRLRWAYAVPVLRGTEDAPVIVIKTTNAAGALLKQHYCAAAVSKRKVITMPADARLVVNLDIAGRVPVTFDIEELP